MEKTYTFYEVSELTGLEYGIILMLVKNKTIHSVNIGSVKGKRVLESQLKGYLERRKL